MNRCGPRPLPLHLANAAVANFGAAALPIIASDQLSPAIDHESVRHLVDRMRQAGAVECQNAVIQLGLKRFETFLEGLLRYQNFPHPRRIIDRPVLAEQGSVRLLDYGGKGPPLLVIPSLINPPDILDLLPDHSFMEWLVDCGFHAVLVDWGEPEEEASFDIGDYITARLEPLVRGFGRSSARPPVVIGYCMGGLLAIGLAARNAIPLSGLALLATPWNFHAGRGAKTAARAARRLLPLIELMGTVPADLMAAFFAALDPMLVERKFRTFATMDPDSSPARLFVAVEDWVNSGSPLAGPVARECLEGWYIENQPFKGEWKIGGQPVIPEKIELRTFLAVPDRDRIVPPASAEALADCLSDATLIRPQSGHIGMIVGGQSKAGLWQPLYKWLKAG